MSTDPQDPLPEQSFLYRRIFSYGTAVSLIGLIAFVVWRIDGDEQLREIALYLCVLLFMVVTYYMVAPSAEHIVKMIQLGKLWRSSPPESLPPELGVEPAIVSAPVEQEYGSDFDAAPRGRTHRGE